MHLFSGSNGLSLGQPAVLDNDEPRPGYEWVTIAEQLEAANVTWRVYQGPDNFDDNGLAWFAAFQQSRPGDALFDKGMARQRNAIQAFADDIATGSLPQVSWIIAPTRKSEHASNHPSAGEDYTAQLLKKLQEYPSIYAKSAFILNYDEGGQFVDHMWVPTPVMREGEGASTIPWAESGEINTEVYADEETPSPIGLGFRVPAIVISPWTRGNIVVSEVFDHISVIKLLESRFNFTCPNVSPWRRAVVGNLLTAFDFEAEPDYSWPDLPDTTGYVIEGDIEYVPSNVVPLFVFFFFHC